MKSSSPFTIHFIQIQYEMRKSLHDLVEENEVENSFYSPDVIEHLETKYMPYCFLWASFTLKNLSEHITRFTNGTLEKNLALEKVEVNFLEIKPITICN